MYGQTDLVGHEGSEVGLLGSIIPGERADVPAVLLRTLLGQEPKRTVARCLKFTVRHGTKVWRGEDRNRVGGGWWRREQRAQSGKTCHEERANVGHDAKLAADEIGLVHGMLEVDHGVLMMAPKLIAYGSAEDLHAVLASRPG